MTDRITAAALDAWLSARPAWTRTAGRDAIGRRFAFADFGEAFGFMTRVALAAEAADHHPEWTNVWNRVDVTLTTHSAGGVTGKDLELAETMDKIAGG